MKKPTASNVALLAPVPLEHLLGGRTTAETEGKVAFGSRAWEVFRDLDHQRKGLPVDVYIYASHSDDLQTFASWYARYIGHVESFGGAHPQGMRYRPPSTAKYPDDNAGYWAIFWEVEDLRPLPDCEHIGLAGLTGLGKKKAYGHGFVPEGPLLIEHP